MKKIGLIIITLYLLSVSTAFAQDQQTDKFTDVKVNLLFGLNQPLIGGFNIEGNLFYKRLAFDYSHGVSLQMDNAILDQANQAQGLDIHIPWTTGFGIGYRVNDWFNLRAEPKWHKFDLYYMGEEQIATNQIGSYTTFSMGIGAYANFQPFKGQDNFLQSIMVAPSIRWWPRVASSLENNELTYFNQTLEKNFTHEAMEVGINNTPLIVNISIGYSFGWDN